MDNFQEVQITQRLQTRYPNGNPQVLQQLASVKRLLMNQVYGNQKLEALQNFLGQRDITLDAFLTEEETQQGFVHRAEVSEFLQRDSFREQLLKMKRHMVDGGTPPDHGPHTHRLQWYIIYQALREHLLPPDVNPVALYHALAGDEFCDSTNPLRTIWDEIFDFDKDAYTIIGVSDTASVDEAMMAAGYSSPEFLLKRLTRDNAIPQGVLTRELKLLRLRRQTFGADGVLNYAAGLQMGILTKTFSQNTSANLKPLEEELKNLSVDTLEERYCELDQTYQQALEALKHI